MKQEFPKATIEQIEREIVKFTNISGEGSFQLSCKLCRDLGIIAVKGLDLMSLKKLKQAAMKFAGQGWRYDKPELICPYCYKTKLL
jgi:hypothetical protein